MVTICPIPTIYSFLSNFYPRPLFIRWTASQVQTFFRKEPIWLAYHSKKIERMNSYQIRRFYFGLLSSLPLAHLYRLKEDNSCQSIWDKSEVLLGTFWGTCQVCTWKVFAVTLPQKTKNEKKKKLAWKVHLLQ